ncbi:MAG: hypothetical protein AABX07_05585 [Nanoarchaeota archaeon]
MSRYHFVRSACEVREGNELPAERISVEYGQYAMDRFGLFIESEHFRDGQSYMEIGNSKGSLMAIDTARDIAVNPINKLHIGDLMMRRPHAESYKPHGVVGFRVDLLEFDTHYLKKELDELRNWRNTEYRRELIARYEAQKKPTGEPTSYHIPFRMQQLGISPEGLERKIEELEKHLTWLRQEPQRQTRRLVYEHATAIENRGYKMVILMAQASQELKLTGKNSKKPKIIKNEDVFNLSALIEADLKAVFDFICPKIDVEKARNYWNEVVEWGKM